MPRKFKIKYDDRDGIDKKIVVVKGKKGVGRKKKPGVIYKDKWGIKY